ncbi:MAG: potassium channel family protein, partial [Bacillota bacterium]
MSVYRKLILSIIIIGLLLLLGTLGYIFLEGWNTLDAFYMTVITISTVGFKEVGELSRAGRLFTVFLIFSSVGTVAYSFGSLIIFVLEGRFRILLKEKRMEKQISELNQHYIVCGAGQTGRNVIKELQKAKVPFVVIEKNPETVEELFAQNIPVIHGDATHDADLERAQIRRAKGVVSTLNNDADNVFTVLSCRQLNPRLYIVSRSIEASSEAKLMKAGADVTVSPNEIGGQRMAALVLKPAIISFLEIVNRGGEDLTVTIQEVEVAAG